MQMPVTPAFTVHEQDMEVLITVIPDGEEVTSPRSCCRGRLPRRRRYRARLLEAAWLSREGVLASIRYCSGVVENAMFGAFLGE